MASMFENVTKISDFLELWLKSSVLPAVEQKTLEKYYSSYRRHFPERLKYFYDRQLAEVTGLIKKLGSPRILEIGCGTGTESLWMALQGAHVDAVELKVDRLNTAKARLAFLEKDLGRSLHCQFLQQSVLELGVEGGYDIVWMEQAFHHLEPREEVVKKIVSLLKPGGFVVNSEANALNPLLQAQLVKRRGFKTIGHFEDASGKKHPYGNERILPASRLSKLFEKEGVDTVSTTHFRLFPNSKAFDGLLETEKAAPEWLKPLFTHYNYVGHRRSRH
jgi:2-polyprenyl-3-methyl-5-hydroxy-6-metoxy-1,4-benzoquinol methylase